MKRKLFCIVLALTLIISTIITGCGSSKNTSDKSTSSDSSAGENEVPAEKTEITFQTWNPAETSCIADIISAFEAINPDIKVNYTHMQYPDHIQALKVEMSSGEGPDVYGMATGAPYLEFRTFEEDITPYAKSMWGDNWKSKFNDFCMELLESDGKYYGLPLGLTYAGLAWADMTMLRSYGIEELPTSYEALLNVSKILREKDQFPMAIGAKDSWLDIDVWMNIANDIDSNKLYSALEGETPFTDEALVKSFEIWQNCFTEGIFQDGAMGMTLYNDVNDMFQREGSIPMILNGSWAMNMYLLSDTETQSVFNSEDSDHDVFMIDWNDDGKMSPLTAAVDVVLSMNSNSKVKEQAFKWIAYLVNEGQDVLVNQYMEYFPSRTDLELNVKGLSEDGKENLDFIIDNAKNNIAGVRTIEYAELKNVIIDQLAALAVNSITPKEAAEVIEAASQAQER